MLLKSAKSYWACLGWLIPFSLAIAPSTSDGLSISVAVPCYYRHFCYLEGLLAALEQQTHLPDEVIVSLSQVEHLDPKAIDSLEHRPYPFTVVILRREGIWSQGPNRAAAGLAASGSIVSYIDADDLPHPQRLEALHRLFEQNPSVHIAWTGHAYCPGNSVCCEPAIPWHSETDYMAMRFSLEGLPISFVNKVQLIDWPSGLHNGSPALRRWVLHAMHPLWTELKNGEDLEFNGRVLDRYGPGLLIRLPLLHYYNARTSGPYMGR